MKKIALVLVMIFSLTTIFSTITYAVSPPISIVVNDEKLFFPDVQPFVDSQGRTQTPAKYIAEALGATVTWMGEEQKAVFTFGKKELILYIGKKTYQVDGQTKLMDTTAVLKDGRTFVPAKYIAESFGADVKWDGTTKTVYVDRTLITQTQEGKDVATGTVVNNQTELMEAIRLATLTLQPTLNLICNNYKSSDYNTKGLLTEYFKEYDVFVNRISTSSYNNLEEITIDITYRDVFKIQQALKNDIASGRLSDKNTQVLSKANDIISQVIKDSMTDYEKELAIHDYLVLNYKYDYDNYENNTIPEESYTIYGLLLNGTGVCQAYAEAMSLLLNLVGVECRVVTGVSNNDNHAWNIVKLDEEYYMLDVTWDDPVPDEPGRVSYGYFNVTSDQLAQSHTWDSSKWPIANGTKYNYFIYNNLVVNNYFEFQQLVIKKLNEGQKDILLYINNYDKYIFDLQFIFNYYYGSSFSHSVPTATNTQFRIILK